MMPDMNNAANDTAVPTTLDVCCTVETATWRAHRYMDSICITSLVNAGKRGKRCEEFSMPGSDAAAFVVFGMLGDASVGAMRTMVAAHGGCETTVRGVDVPMGEVRIHGRGVRGTFSTRRVGVVFTVSGNDSVLAISGAKAAKVHAWALTHGRRLAEMTEAAFRAEMVAIGVQFG